LDAHVAPVDQFVVLRINQTAQHEQFLKDGLSCQQCVFLRQEVDLVRSIDIVNGHMSTSNLVQLMCFAWMDDFREQPLATGISAVDQVTDAQS
jgi:hypothetical protein